MFVRIPCLHSAEGGQERVSCPLQWDLPLPWGVLRNHRSLLFSFGFGLGIHTTLCLSWVKCFFTLNSSHCCINMLWWFPMFWHPPLCHTSLYHSSWFTERLGKVGYSAPFHILPFYSQCILLCHWWDHPVMILQSYVPDISRVVVNHCFIQVLKALDTVGHMLSVLKHFCYCDKVLKEKQ